MSREISREQRCRAIDHLEGRVTKGSSFSSCRTCRCVCILSSVIQIFVTRIVHVACKVLRLRCKLLCRAVRRVGGAGSRVLRCFASAVQALASWPRCVGGASFLCLAVHCVCGASCCVLAALRRRCKLLRLAVRCVWSESACLVLPCVWWFVNNLWSGAGST